MSDELGHRNWLELPRDVTAEIFSRVGAIEILSSVQNVCSLWFNICKDPSIWRSIDMRDLRDMDYDLVRKMCVHAVDRSKGDLVDINLDYSGTDELLAYISERSSHLRRLGIACGSGISDEGLSEAVSKLPLLEELDITNYNISADALQVVGCCCPHLKSLTFNNWGDVRSHIESDEDAQVIAQSMHELRHLQLVGNKLTNCGLQAILDGCPHLQSLDLRRCFGVSLQGDLEKRCAEQIRHLRRPHDSIQNFEIDAMFFDLPEDIIFDSPFEDYDEDDWKDFWEEISAELT